MVDILVESEILNIRSFSTDDIKDFIGFMLDPESTRFLEFDEAQKNPEGARQLILATIESYSTDSPLMAYAIEDRSTEKFVGFCGLTPLENNDVEIMYAILSPYRGKGFAVETANKLAQFALKQLAYDRVIAPISTDHIISRAVAEKAGFVDHGLRTQGSPAKKVHLFVYENTE